MFSLSKILSIFLLLIFFQGAIQASNGIPIPSALYSIDDLVGQFRNPLKTKIEDLKKNYRYRSTSNVILYSSHEQVNCLFQNWDADSTLTKLEYFFRNQGREALDVLRYNGCGDQLSLVERFIRVGDDQQALSFNEFSNANLSFTLRKEWDRFYYQLQNNLGENLISLAARWVNEAKNHAYYSFSIRDQEFLIVNYQYLPNETRVTYTFRGFHINYQYLPWFNMNLSQNHNGFSFKVIVKSEAPETPFFLSSQDTQLSQNTFLQYFSYWANTNGFDNVKKFVDFHLYWFPPTEFLNTGGQSQRLINELRLNLNRILNNNNLNLVEVYLRNLIQSVEQGLILDRRPLE